MSSTASKSHAEAEMQLVQLSEVVFLVILSVVFAADKPVPQYTIDLDQPPKERWREVIEDFRKPMYSLLSQMQQEFSPAVAEMFSIMEADLIQYIPEPYASEITSFANGLNVTIGQIVFWNMLYEVTAYNESDNTACTSIVANIPADGSIIHGRNLDYGFPVLRELAVQIAFTKQGRTIYTGTTFAGYVGLMTGQRANGFTISLDERDKGEWWRNAVEAAATGTHGIVSFLIRDLLADETVDFNTAVTALATSQLIAPCYLIVGGTKTDEGVVITHDRTGAEDIWHLDQAAGQWFLVETNYDHWDPPPYSDDRRDPAEKAMNSTGQENLSKDTLFQVLSTPPVLNDGTMFTAIMSAANPDIYSSWVRDAN